MRKTSEGKRIMTSEEFFKIWGEAIERVDNRTANNRTTEELECNKDDEDDYIPLF